MAPLTQNKKGEDINKYLENSQGKSYFVAAATVIFLLVFILLGVLPAYSAVFDQIAANEARDEAITKYESKISTLQSFDAEATNKSDLLVYFENVFPLFDGTQDEIVNRIFDTANAADITVISSVLGEIDAGEQQIDISLLDSRVKSGLMQARFRGSREDLLTYVGTLEDSRFVFDLRSTTLSKISEDQQNIDNSELNGDHQLNLQIQFYYWDDSDLTLTAN